MKLLTMFVVVALVSALCSAQPVTSEPEQPHTSGVLRLKKRSAIIITNGNCPEGRTQWKQFCIPDEEYWDYDDSATTPEPDQPHPSGVLRLKRQAPAFVDGHGKCPKGQIKVKYFCMDKEKYWEMKGEYYDDFQEE